MISSTVFFVSLMAIVLCILVFCADYLATSRDYLRFVVILLSFVLSIVVLITHRSLFILFLGWDGLGVTSYVLVQYYLN